MTTEQFAGEPAREIGRSAKEVRADPVVVGHHKLTLLERWGSGPGVSYVSDHLGCRPLIARAAVSDEAFEAEIQGGAGAP